MYITEADTAGKMSCSLSTFVFSIKLFYNLKEDWFFFILNSLQNRPKTSADPGSFFVFIFTVLGKIYCNKYRKHARICYRNSNI